MKLHKDVIEDMFRHALEEYPHECCGIITSDRSTQYAHRCRNIQNQLHDEDPVRYPRDARTAYVIDREEFDNIINSAKADGRNIIAFYHSHCDHESYFSEEDVAAQTVFGEPEFPDVKHVVVSVMGGRINSMKCFAWDNESSSFVECRNG